MSAIRSRLRILAGSLKGRRLEFAPGIRPTEAQVREALFSIWRERVPGCRFLDLYAGSGAVGLEAVSRGARWVRFVDDAPRVLATLRRNAQELAAGTTEVRRLHLPRRLEVASEERFDLVFIDPPYRFDRHAELLSALDTAVTADADLALEHSVHAEPGDHPGPWRLHDLRRYGDSCLSFYRL